MERFGKYELLAKLGQGGMAEVYLARAMLAEGLQKLLTVKKIHPAFSENPHFVSMFKQEATIATELNHPNIVQVFDFGTLGASFFLVMEYVDGMDLMRLHKKSSAPVPFGLAAYVVKQLAQGLDYAHRKKDPFGNHLGIVHRDVSPQNVLVSYDGAVKIVDFGIAKARDQDEEKGVVKGKFAYMSPEQALGQKVDQRADIFSAGIVLYELIAGRTPFAELKGNEALEAVRRSDIPPPSEFRSGVPPALEAIVTRAVARNPEERYQSGRDLQSALVKYLYALHSQSGEIHDSESLARFVEETVPEDERFSTTQVVRDAPMPQVSPRSHTQASLEIPLDRASGDSRVVEKKKVVAVAGRFEGWQELGEDVKERQATRLLQELRHSAEDVAYKLDARLKTLGEAGFCIIVGVPVSGEDDPSRAIRLARSLVESWEQVFESTSLRLRIKVGLARGQAEVKRGPGVGFEYKVLGKVTDLALLLADHARPGGIVVGGGVHRGAREEWDFDEVGSTEFHPDRSGDSSSGSGSALTRTVQAYRVVGPKPRQQQRRRSHTQVVLGRELELKGLQDAYREVATHRQSRVVAIMGEAGVGKRSMVDALLRQMDPKPGHVVRASARQWNQNLPYSMVADMCRDFLDLEEWSSRDELRDKAERFAKDLLDDEGNDASVHRDVFLLLLGGAAPAQLSIPADPEHRQKTIGSTLQLAVESMARQDPVVVVLEEYHWADHQSRQLVRSFIGRLPSRPVLTIVTSRPDDALKELVAEGKVDPFYLKELDEDDSRRLVESRFVDPRGSEPLIRQILAKGGGNPYYLNAILESLVDQGVCVPADKDSLCRLVWTKKDTSVQFPPTVEALVSARLDQLPARARSVLRKASVLGRSIRPEELRALAEEDVTKELGELESRGLLSKEEDGSGCYVFTKQVILDVAHQGLSTADAKRLHRKAAELFESERLDTPGRAARIAWHEELAGLYDKAAAHYWEAAREAQDVYGHKEAFHFLGKALELGGKDAEQAFEMHWQRESILSLWGKREAQRKELAILEDLAKKLATQEAVAKVCHKWMGYYQSVSRANKVLEIFDRAWEAAEKSGNTELMGETLKLQGRALNEVGRNTAALEAFKKARSLKPTEEQKSKVWGGIWHYEGNALLYIGDYRRAVAAYTKAREIYRSLDLRRQEGTILNNMGFVSLNLGRFEEAIQYLKASSRIDVDLGNRDALGVKLSNLGQVYSALGLLDKAMRHLLKAEDLCLSVEDSSYQADAIISIGQVHLNRGDYRAAASEIRRALRLAEGADSRYDIVRAQIYLSAALIQGPGSAEEALQLARKAAELSREARMPQGEIFGQSMAARALAALDRTEEALGMSAQAVARLATCGYVAESEVILHAHAMILAGAGRKQEARPYMEKALHEIRRKKDSISSEELRRSYLSVPPARDIVSDYTRHFKKAEADPSDPR